MEVSAAAQPSTPTDAAAANNTPGGPRELPPDRRSFRPRQYSVLDILSDGRNPRLDTPFIVRESIASTVAFFAGMSLGIAHGAQKAGLRFRAEHAHRMPNSAAGWYLYHKSKNYHTILGGVKDGFKMGGRVGGWTAMFFLAEHCVDGGRGKKDFLGTVAAGMATAGAFSVKSECSSFLFDRA